MDNLMDQLQEIINECGRQQTEYALMVVDVDRFKLLNDSFGRSFGDALLASIEKRMRDVIGDGNHVFQLGGDQFIIVLPKLANRLQITAVSFDLISAFNQPFNLDGHIVNITLSVGICIYPQDGSNVFTLITRADLAMRKAKGQGGNQLVYYVKQLNKQLVERVQLELELQEALNSNAFFLVYQPQIDLKNKQVNSLEALIRWQHPERGVVLPMDFIPVAESNGMIIQIGHWVLNEACRQLEEWRKMGLPIEKVSINISPRQLMQPHFATEVQDLLREHHLDPDCLEFEMMKHVNLSYVPIQNMIKRLREMGISIILDDFGVGNSSFVAMQQLPVERLKIDESFVHRIAKSQDDELFIEDVLMLSKIKQFSVVAEGVETKEQYNFLKNRNCERAQGFLFSKPLLPAEVEVFLKKLHEKTFFA